MFPGGLIKVNIFGLEHLIPVAPKEIRVPVTLIKVNSHWSKELADDFIF